MLHTTFLALVLSAPVPKDPPSPWRADPPPADCQANLLNEGLPRSWEKGTVHVLAWATVADDYLGEATQAVVLKQFDQPTKDNAHRWVLSLLYHDPKKPKRPWRGPQIHFSPAAPGEKEPVLTDAQLWGYEFYSDRPTDEQVGKFLGQAGWNLRLGTEKVSLSNGEKVKITRTLSAGGVNPVVWRKVFEREMPTRLFPELRKPEEKK